MILYVDALFGAIKIQPPLLNNLKMVVQSGGNAQTHKWIFIILPFYLRPIVAQFVFAQLYLQLRKAIWNCYRHALKKYTCPKVGTESDKV